MDAAVLCQDCKKHVSPSVAVWDGRRLTFVCPVCGSKNSQAGRFSELLVEVH